MWDSVVQMMKCQFDVFVVQYRKCFLTFFFIVIAIIDIVIIIIK